MDIVPALLATTRETFEEKLAMLASFAPVIQIDIADGTLVQNTTIALSDITALPLDVVYEVHLMVDNPMQYIAECERLGIHRIIIHHESKDDIIRAINVVHGKGMEVVVALNPGTPIDVVPAYINVVDGILLMSVNPGFSGAPFIPAVLEKARAVHHMYPGVFLEIDGGIKRYHLKDMRDAGVQRVHIGSAILEAYDPERVWRELSTFVK